MIRRTLLLMPIFLCLAACAKQIATPTEVDACFEAVAHKDGTVAFQRLSQHEATMESCAGALEGMRERFLGLGGSRHNLVGTYNGHYLFLGPAGVQTSDSVDGVRYPFLVRSDDGRLVAAGADMTP